MSDIINNLTILTRLDRANIDAAITAAQEMRIAVKNGYSGELPANGELIVNDMDAGTLEAFKVFTDAMTYDYEAGYQIIKVAYDPGTKTFDFSGSYLRDQVATEGVTELAEALPIKVRFELPGFETNPVVEVTYLYHTGFSGDDKTLLSQNGIMVTTMDAYFIVSNTVDCKVFFEKPAGSMETYVIDYPALNTIVPKIETEV